MPRVRRSTHTQAAKHWKIGIYIRLSREDKEKEEEQIGNRRGKRRIPQNVASDSSGSIIEQDKILTEWVEDYFREEHYTIVEYFTDDGLTGTDDTRDDFQRMMEFSQDGRINCIVVKTLSRAFRNYADQGRYLEQIFPRLGVRFISSGNPFVDSYNDPDAITGGMEIPINGLMNDRFAAKTSRTSGEPLTPNASAGSLSVRLRHTDISRTPRIRIAYWWMKRWPVSFGTFFTGLWRTA